MQMVIPVTSKWQLHIPKSIRSALKISRSGRMEIKTQGNKLLLTPVESKILKFAGKYEKYAKGKGINLNKIRDYIDYSKA